MLIMIDLIGRHLVVQSQMIRVPTQMVASKTGW
jgi:hypothetical protein